MGNYGKDYPHPIIAPVSIMGTEEKEEEARQAQTARDRQISAAKRPRQSYSGGKGDFNKERWEHSRQQWPAETPTSADTGEKGKGKRNHTWRRGGGDRTGNDEASSSAGASAHAGNNPGRRE